MPIIRRRGRTRSARNLRHGLLYSYALEEPSGNRQDRVGGYELTMQGTPTNMTGKFGQAMQLTRADNEYAFRNSEPSFHINRVMDWTASAWVNLASKPAALMYYLAITTEYSLGWFNTTDRFIAILGSAAENVQATAFGAPALSTWYHVLTWFHAGTKRAFTSVNGSAPESAVITGNMDTTTFNLNIGARNGTAPWDGGIDEVNFWTRLLTPAESALLYNGGEGTPFPFR
jgi:hypothetical protein